MEKLVKWKKEVKLVKYKEKVKVVNENDAMNNNDSSRQNGYDHY